MNRVAVAVGRVTEGNQPHIGTGMFQPLDLLCDEGFGQARIALEHDSQFQPRQRA